MSSPAKFPKARSEQLLIEQIEDESVIYDLDTHVAHALKPLAAAVFMYADGSRTTSEIAELATIRLGHDVTAAEVEEAVDQLSSVALVEFAEQSGLSRRDALKAFVAAGAGTMLVSSVLAPGAMAANLTCASGTPNIATASSFPGGWGSSFNQDTNGHRVSSFGIAYGTHGTTALMYLQPSSILYVGHAPLVTSGNNTGCYYMTGGSNYFWSGGTWMCVPCTPGTGSCCQVVCADSSLNDRFYNLPPAGFPHLRTTGSYYGLYCT